MHPLMTAYLRWRALYVKVVFWHWQDLSEAKDEAWNFYRELRGENKNAVHQDRS